MKNFFKNSIYFFVLLAVFQKQALAQACFTPSINAQAGTGPSTVICAGQCANLTATLIPPPNSTTTYSVASVTYSTLPYFGGNNVFSTSTDDLWSDSISIGFNFCYYGNTYKKLLVGSNGEITFDLTKANAPESWITTAILPNLIEHPGNTICGAYRDYDPLPGGVVRTYTTGVAPCRQFVAYWSGVTLFSCSTPVSSFQIVLYETTNQIAVNIINSTACVSWNGGRGLIGIQNALATTVVAPPTRNTLTAWTAINESWRFYPTAAPSYSVSWAGPSSFTASGLTATACPTASGNYTATMSYCNGSATSTVGITVATPTVIASASSSTVCAPGSVTLTGSGATTYTWLPGSLTGPTIAVSPTVNTTYTLLGTSGACTGSTSISITVGTPPTVNAFNLSGTICPGNFANAVATGALSYTWNPGGIIGNIVALSPTVTTTYTVLGSSGGCVGQATVIIPVGNTPTITASISPIAICPGNSATLTASGAITYTWNPGAVIGSSVVVTPIVTTIYTVTGTSTLTCPGTQTVMLTVNPIPTITAVSNPAAICVGGTATLTSSGATTYTWMPGSLSGATVTVSPAATTIYTVTGSNGACSTTKTVQTIVNAVPTVTASASSSTVCAGTSLTLTAGGATTYTWNPGSLTGAVVVVTPIANTTYTVIGSSGTCTNSANVSVTVSPSPILTAVANPTVICSGAGTTVTLTSSGAATYTWMPGSLSGATVTVTPAITTTYTVTGASAAGCSSTNTVVLTVNTTPTVTASASSSTICAGSTVTLTSTGATTYTWMPGSLIGSTVTASPLSNTVYTVTGANGSCTNSNTVSVTVTPGPVVSAISSPTLICSGGSATLTGSGATSYTWNPGASTSNPFVVSPATTTIYTLTGSNGTCSGTVAVTLSVTPNPTVTAISNPTIICSGSTATLTGSGATSYTWMPGSLTGASVSVSPTSTTVYTVTGANGACSNTNTVSLSVVPNPTVSATSNPTTGIICSGKSATLTANGAVTYTWMPGSMVAPIIVVNPTITTTYTLTGAIGGICTNSVAITITVVPSPTITVAASSTAICSGQSTTLTASGGVGTYSWIPGPVFGNPQVFSPTVSTTYTVVGANAIGCKNNTSILILVTPTPTVTAAASSATICSGNTVTLTSTGATTYTWMPGSLSGATVTASPTITTTYTVTGANGSCTGTNTVLVNVSPNPTVTASSSPTTPICSGGSATLTGSGATTYTWMPGSLSGTSVTVNPITTTVYTITGANGSCTNTNTVSVTVTSGPTITAVSSPTSICSGSSATLTGSGATSYTWMPGSLSGATVAVSTTITTSYTLTGTNGVCSSTVAVTLTVTNTPTLTTSSTPAAICAGASATLTSSGATSYTWMPGSLSGATVVVTPTTTTIYTVTGANGSCVNTKTISLTVNPTPTVSAVSNPVSMCAGSSATLTGSGATTYTWMPGSLSGATVVVSPTVTTTFTVTGSNGTCSKTNTVSVTIFSSPVVVAATSKTVLCLGDTATLSAAGAASYTWNPGATIGTPIVVTPTATTIYTVTGSNGICSSNATVSILVNTYPTVTAVSSPTSLCVGSSATLTGSGATTYTWMPGSLSGATVIVSPTITTTYSITGANGSCTGTKTLNLVVNPNPTITASSTPTTPLCAGSSITLTASGATTYTWMPGSLTGSTVVVTPATNTTYTVTGANASGCSSTKTINVTVIPGPTITAVSNPTIICSGQTGTLTATGGLTYTWMPVAVTGASIIVSPTVTTTYTVTGINLTGCTKTQTVTLVVNSSPTITANTTSTILCSGASATLSSSGATTYSWNPGALTGATVVVTPTTTTTYTVVGANGTCTNTKTLSITVNPTPTVTSSATPTILCAGGTSTLTASGATSYTWMPPAITGSLVVVSPTVITIYTVTGANASGCSSTSTVLVNVNTPTITTIATPTSVCIGSSATITASGASTYTWMPGATTGTSVVVNPTVTTTYTVTGVNAFGCTGTKTINLIVVPLPTVTAVSSSTAVCAGNSATFTGSGATTYTWMPGSLTGTSVVVTPTATSVYTVTGSNSGCSSSNTISITVNPNPTVTGVANPTIICSGATSTLTGFGATSYTWNPGSLVAIVVSVTATTTTVYTVTGADALGCTNSNTVLLVVNTPTLTTIATPSSICTGSSATITASGATTYTWNPGAATGSSVVVNPTVTTTYSVTGTNTMGCQGTKTISITVFVNPTVTASASSTTICSGLSTTLTSSGATTYTWLPGSLTGATVVVTPTTTTTYSVIGVNGVCAADTATITVNVKPSPQNVTATNSGTITCLTPSVNLFGSTTSTNVAYQWTGPSSYTSSTQNPTGITNGGTYTLSVIDLTNGCITTATTAVKTNTNGPSVTLTSTGTITCLSNTVNISVSSTVAAVTYTWSGPSSFTSTATSFTTSVGGVYTVSALDPATGCTSTNTVVAMTNTYVAVSATIIPSTCTGSVTNNNGTILASNFIATDKYDLVVGPTYTGSATYATASIVGGIITTTLVNPAVNTPYTIRFFGANGCFKDTTLILVPVDCSVNNSLGLAKAITAVTTNTNGTYGVTYKVVVKNTGFATLNNVVLTENLSNTFPLPTTFTVSSAPVIITPVTSLTLDPTFNGSTQPVLTNTVSSSLIVGETDTIVFTINVLPNGVFGPFNNSVLGIAVGGSSSTVVRDSSQVGLNTDPDSDGNPTNNNTPTPLNITPSVFFGVTKQGELSQALSDGSYDITYTVSIHNLGNDTLRKIVLKDSLAGTTIKSPASYSMKSGPFTSGLLMANSSYNGNSDPNLVVTANSKIAPNTVQSFVFSINVMLDTVTVIRNYAIGSAMGSNSVTVRDTSNNGNNPDTNGNGIWNEPVDNVPTVLIIDKFFVPEVFTPNGDGTNDFFVIKGIQKTENTLTIFNRWGNKVYKMDNYDNTWAGMPNVSGTLGNQKLPQGTYYYILEFKGETNLKTVNGFVVLQY